jgi:hypothetical protein
VLTDGDTADTSTGTLTVTILDDEPIASLSTENLSDIELVEGGDVAIASFDLDGTAVAGADGIDSASYSIRLNNDNGTYAGFNTTAGAQIFLYQLDDGLIVGSTQVLAGGETVSDLDDANIVFSIDIDATNGQVTLESTGLFHDPVTNDNEVVLADTISIDAVYTVVDNDGDVSEAPADIGDKIKFIDGVPVIINVDDGVITNETLATLEGTWDFDVKADGLQEIGITLNNPPDVILSSTMEYIDGVATFTAYFDVAQTQPYFELIMNEDGTYTFNIINANPTVIETDTTTTTGGKGGNPPEIYLEELLEIGDDLNTDIRFTSQFGTETGTTVNANNQGLGAKTSGGTASLPVSTGESITLEFLETDGVIDGTVTNGGSRATKAVQIVTLGFVETNGTALAIPNAVFYVELESGPVVEYVVGVDPEVVDNGAGSYTINAPEGDGIVSIVVANEGNGTPAFLINSVSTTTVVEVINPEDLNLEFTVDVTDGDFDTSSYNFNIGIDAEGNFIGTADADTIIGSDNGDVINGGAGNDIISGGLGGDTLSGQVGDDILIGGEGNDILSGGLGNDTLTGGTGADTFVFSLAQNEGNDIIKDFDSANDVLQFTDVIDSGDGGGIDLTDLNSHITDVADNGDGGSVVVTFDTGATLTFEGAGTVGNTITTIDQLVGNPVTQIDVS